MSAPRCTCLDGLLLGDPFSHCQPWALNASPFFERSIYPAQWYAPWTPSAQNWPNQDGENWRRVDDGRRCYISFEASVIYVVYISPRSNGKMTSVVPRGSEHNSTDIRADMQADMRCQYS